MVTDKYRESLKSIIEKSTDPYFESGSYKALEKLIDINYNLANDATNTVTVSLDSEITNIKQALDNITDSSPDNRYTIYVAPGTYIENNPIVGKPYVTVKAIGDNNNVRVIANNPNEDLFIGANLFYLLGLSLFGVSGVNNYALNHNVSGEIVVRNCTFTDCSNGILVNNINANLNLINSAILTINENSNVFVKVIEGEALIDLVKVVSESNVSTIIECSGTNSRIEANGVSSHSNNVNCVFDIKGGSKLNGTGNKIENAYDGLVVEGDNTTVRLDALQLYNNKNDGFRVNNIGSNIEVDLFSTSIFNSESLNVNILNPNCIVTGNGYTEIDKSYIVIGARFYAYLLDTKEDDEGFNVIGELHVGIPERPTESVMGGGDSYTRGMKVYTYDGTNYVDVSVEAGSASDSTFTFPNTNINSAIYVASTLENTDKLEHFGIKASVVSGTDLGTGDIIVEYWNGVTWEHLSVMDAQSGDKYYPRADRLFVDSCSCHVRYNSYLANDNWTKNDPVGYGENLYWVRYRISSQINAAPVFQQFKLHTSRFEVNKDGWLEFFGTARPIKQLPLNFSESKPFEGNMQNQTLYVSQNIGEGFQQNNFTSQTDKTGIAGFLPIDLDTSSPIKLILTGRPSATENITFTVRWAWLTNDDPIYTGEPAAITNSKETTVTKSVVSGQLAYFDVFLDVSKTVARRETGFGDQLWISIQPSTMTGTFALAASNINYVAWSSGGHI